MKSVCSQTYEVENTHFKRSCNNIKELLTTSLAMKLKLLIKKRESAEEERALNRNKQSSKDYDRKNLFAIVDFA